jgi:hypothetical protein
MRDRRVRHRPAAAIEGLRPISQASRGGALGLMSAVVAIAGLIAPTLIRRLIDTQGQQGYQHAVLLTGGLLLIAGLLIDPDRDAQRLTR